MAYKACTRMTVSPFLDKIGCLAINMGACNRICEVRTIRNQGHHLEGVSQIQRFSKEIDYVNSHSCCPYCLAGAQGRLQFPTEKTTRDKTQTQVKEVLAGKTLTEKKLFRGRNGA